MKLTKRILIIDDAFEAVSNGLKKLQFENIIKTGPARNAMEGMKFICDHGQDADFILLDMELAEELDAGSKIFSMLSEDLKKKVIAITGEPLAKKIFRNFEIIHTPGKHPDDIVKCIFESCSCGYNEEVKEGYDPIASKCDILIVAMHKSLVLATANVLKTLLPWKRISYFCAGRQALEFILENKPKVLLYFQDMSSNTYSCLEHDYSHYSIESNRKLPEFKELYGKAISASAMEEECVKNAQSLGHDSVSYLSVGELVNVVSSYLNKRDIRELEIRIRPMFDHSKCDELVEIARTMSKTSAKEAALYLTGDEIIARACRWLAVIRVEFGSEKFEEVIVQNRA